MSVVEEYLSKIQETNYKIDPLQELRDIRIESGEKVNILYAIAKQTNVTFHLLGYLYFYLEKYGIPNLSIGYAYMRSGKSMLATLLVHIMMAIRHNLGQTDKNCDANIDVCRNQIDMARRIQKDDVTRRTLVSDETIRATGQGSKTIGLQISNIVEVCAKNETTMIFINPNEFMFEDVCLYGLSFIDADWNTLQSRWMVWALQNPTGMGKIPLGYFVCKKYVDEDYVKEKLSLGYAGYCKKWGSIYEPEFKWKRYTSEYEEVYETKIKNDMVARQMKLVGNDERLLMLQDDIEFVRNSKMFDKWKNMQCDQRTKPTKLFNSLVYLLGTKYTKAEIGQMKEWLMSYDDLLDSGLLEELERLKGEL